MSQSVMNFLLNGFGYHKLEDILKGNINGNPKDHIDGTIFAHYKRKLPFGWSKFPIPPKIHTLCEIAPPPENGVISLDFMKNRLPDNNPLRKWLLQQGWNLKFMSSVDPIQFPQYLGDYSFFYFCTGEQINKIMQRFQQHYFPEGSYSYEKQSDQHYRIIIQDESIVLLLNGQTTSKSYCVINGFFSLTPKQCGLINSIRWRYYNVEGGPEKLMAPRLFEFIDYALTTTYKPGQHISHSEYGEGKVITSSPFSIQVDFGGNVGEKGLAHNRKSR